MAHDRIRYAPAWDQGVSQTERTTARKQIHAVVSGRCSATPRTALFAVGAAIGAGDPGITGEMLPGMHARPIGRVEEYGSRRIGAGHRWTLGLDHREAQEGRAVKPQCRIAARRRRGP